MPRIYHRRAFRTLGLLAVVATSLGLMGCPGSLDPSLLGGGTGTGGTGGGGSGGTSSSNCTGNLAGPTLITGNCAYSGCHVPNSILGAGLDLTPDATVGARLVGVLSPGDANAQSVCGGFQTPYLVVGSNPAQGLLINKITTAYPNDAELCPGGQSMPYGMNLLPAAEQTCIEQWAEGLIMAAGTQ